MLTGASRKRQEALPSASQSPATAVGALAEVPEVFVVLSRIVLLLRLKTVLTGTEETPVVFWVIRLLSSVTAVPLEAKLTPVPFLAIVLRVAATVAATVPLLLRARSPTPLLLTVLSEISIRAAAVPLRVKAP